MITITGYTGTTANRYWGMGWCCGARCAQDAEALADFNARVHSDEGTDKPDERLWRLDL